MRRKAITPFAAKGATEIHAYKKKKKMQPERCLVPNMAESRGWCGHPGLGTVGHRGSQGADRHSPCSSGMRDLLSGTKKIPAGSGKTQLSTRLARAARYVNRNHLSKGLEGAWFSWLGQNGRYRDKPGAVPGHGAHCVPPSMPSARAGGGPKPTLGAPAPPGWRHLPDCPRPGQPVRSAGQQKPGLGEPHKW